MRPFEEICEKLIWIQYEKLPWIQMIVGETNVRDNIWDPCSSRTAPGAHLVSESAACSSAFLSTHGVCCCWRQDVGLDFWLDLWAFDLLLFSVSRQKLSFSLASSTVYCPS